MEPNKKTSDFRLPSAEVFKIAALLDYKSDSVVSREILKGTAGKVLLFAFDAGKGMAEHTSPYEALVQVLEGDVEITVFGKPHCLTEGDLILLPADQPHALKGIKRFKMVLTLIGCDVQPSTLV
jgi:quercetin dioxygenase-like cupin family protein